MASEEFSADQFRMETKVPRLSVLFSLFCSLRCGSLFFVVMACQMVVATVLDIAATSKAAG